MIAKAFLANQVTMAAFPTYPDFDGKVALVMEIGQSDPSNTDAWGNGAAMAFGLCCNNVKLFGCDLRLPAAAFTARGLRETGAVSDVMAADVTELEDVQKVVGTVMAKYGRIDTLVNNVGMPAAGDPATLAEDVWDQQKMLTSKACTLPVMLSCQS